MFKAERKSQFVDVNANRILVEYGTEPHTQTLSNGVELEFDRKVRVTLHTGKRITLYQNLSTQGVRYVTANKDFTFIEKGSYCQVFDKNTLIYQGIFSRNLTEKKK